MNLPHSPYLSIDKLSSVFSSTSATYKFYWFLSILELVEEGNNIIDKQRLFSRMISIGIYHFFFRKETQMFRTFQIK